MFFFRNKEVKMEKKSKKMTDEQLLRKLIFIKREMEPLLWKLSCVQGLGVGYKYSGGEKTDQPAITVFVTRKIPARYLATSGIVPSRLVIPDPTEDGKPIEIITDVFESGYYSVHPYTTKHRPAHGGDSIGHIDITAGTLGCLVGRPWRCIFAAPRITRESTA